MSDVQYTNFSLQSSNHSFSAIWKLTRALKKAGWTYMSSSNGTTKDTTGTASNDKWGGSADPSDDSYPTSLDSVAAWWNASGPTVVKIPFTTASTGTFLRGEKITQATSLAEGEIVGYEFDGVSTGHIVVLPRTGTFDNSHVITGASSSATLTPSGTVEFFVSEVVFFKSSANTTQGSTYIQRVSDQTENASRFSVLANSAGCTATIAPGAGGTGNGFPSAGSWVMCGSQISGSVTHSNWVMTATNLGRAQIVAANCTPATGVSPDGTWWILMGDVSSSTSTEFIGYFRMDNSEDGDLDPFVTFKPTQTLFSNANIRVDGTGSNLLSVTNFWTQNGASTAWKGWRRRGFSSNDSFVPCTTGQLNYGNGDTSTFMAENQANPETIACAYTTKRLREPLHIVSDDNTKKIRKGTVRWMFAVQGGTAYDTWDAKTKVCVLAPSTNVGSVIAGPYDGTTTPLQS